MDTCSDAAALALAMAAGLIPIIPPAQERSGESGGKRREREREREREETHNLKDKYMNCMESRRMNECVAKLMLHHAALYESNY